MLIIVSNLILKLILNQKYNVLVLGEGPTNDINGSTGTTEKK